MGFWVAYIKSASEKSILQLPFTSFSVFLLRRFDFVVTNELNLSNCFILQMCVVNSEIWIYFNNSGLKIKLCQTGKLPLQWHLPLPEIGVLNAFNWNWICSGVSCCTGHPEFKLTDPMLIFTATLNVVIRHISINHILLSFRVVSTMIIEERLPGRRRGVQSVSVKPCPIVFY